MGERIPRLAVVERAVASRSWLTRNPALGFRLGQVYAAILRIFLPRLCFTAGFAVVLRGVAQSDAAYRNSQRQLAAEVVPAWETQSLKQDIDPPLTHPVPRQRQGKCRHRNDR